MKSYSVQKLTGKPVIIITLTNPTRTQHTQHILRQIDACRQAQTVYLIYDVTPLKLNSGELNRLMGEVQADLLAEAPDSRLTFVIVTSPGLAQGLSDYEPFEDTDFVFFTSLDQALAFTTSKLIKSNGVKH
jgi:hypothetical protein